MAGIDALLALQRLMAPGRTPASAAQYGINPEMNESQPPSPLSSLPDEVLASIMQRPSYAEGQKIPRQAWTEYESFAPELQLQRQGQPEREQPLQEALAFQRYALPRSTFPLDEGQTLRPLGSPYSRPYNLGLGNLGALY